MLALAVKAAHVFFDDEPPPDWQWWALTMVPVPGGFWVQGERSTFFFSALVKERVA